VFDNGSARGLSFLEERWPGRLGVHWKRSLDLGNAPEMIWIRETEDGVGSAKLDFVVVKKRQHTSKASGALVCV
jgi:hypothetical protein